MRRIKPSYMVELRGYNKNFMTIKDTVEEFIEYTVNRHAFAYYNVIKQTVPVWTGQLRDSLRLRIYTQPDENGEAGFDVYVDGTFEEIPQAVVMEFGRRKGVPVPICEKLKAWAQDKNINVYAVAKSIARKGIKPRRYGRKAWQKVLKMSDAQSTQPDTAIGAKTDTIEQAIEKLKEIVAIRVKVY